MHVVQYIGTDLLELQEIEKCALVSLGVEEFECADIV